MLSWNEDIIKKSTTNYHQHEEAKPSSFKIMLVKDEQDPLLNYKKFILDAAAEEEYIVDAFTQPKILF